MPLSINILYGSQNGTARHVAENLDKDLSSENIPTTLLTLNEYKNAEYTDNHLNIIIISTTGDGEPPDNAIYFYNGLLSGDEFITSSLTNKRYGLLGLGDSYFTYFCKPSKDIDSKLQEIGSKKVIDTAFGDDAKNLDEIIENWVKSVKHYIKNESEKEAEVSPTSTTSSEEENIRNIMEGIELTNNSEDNISIYTTETSGGDSVDITTGSGSIMDMESEEDSDDEDDEDEETIDIEYIPVMLDFDKELLSQITQLKHVVKKPISYLNLTSASNLCRSVNYSRTQEIFPLLPKKLNSDHNILQYSENNPFPAKILSTQCLTSRNAIKKTIQVTMDITGLDWNYQPGYAFGIIAPNSDKLVLPLLKRLGLDPEDGFRAITTHENLCSGLPVMLNKNYTYYEAFKYFININSVPKKSFLRMLAEYCTDKEDKKQLYFLCSSQGAPSYRHLKSQYPSLLDILYTFKSCHPPFVAILENSSRIAPRYYSITSSPFHNPNIISFMFNVESYKMPVSEDGKTHTRYGLCTGWLEEKLEYPSIPDCIVNFRSRSVTLPIFPKIVNTFVLPPCPLEKSIIMAGPGTGVAPFISFIEYKRHLLEDGTLEHHPKVKTSLSTSTTTTTLNTNTNTNIDSNSNTNSSSNTTSTTPWLLFYGCRSMVKDCLIKDYTLLWRQTVTNERLGCTQAILNDLVITTSREGNGPKYIQDAMKLSGNGRELSEQLKERNTYIYVCGNKSMCKGIHEALVEVLHRYQEMSVEEAESHLDILYKEKRYLRDIWG